MVNYTPTNRERGISTTYVIRMQNKQINKLMNQEKKCNSDNSKVIKNNTGSTVYIVSNFDQIKHKIRFTE